MPVPHQLFWLTAGQSLSVAVLAAGSILLVRLLRQWWRHGAPAGLSRPETLQRLQARAWHPLDAGVLLIAILLPALMNLYPQAPEPSARVQLAPVFLYYAVLLAGVAAAARHTRQTAGALLGISRQAWAPAARAGLVFGLATLPAVLLIACLTELVLQGLGLPSARQAVFDTLSDPGVGLVAQGLLALLAVAVAPLAEESIFRGLLLPVALRSGRPWRAVLLVNLLFALLHLHLPSFLPLLCAGTCFSLGMRSTGSLLTPLIMHAIFNGEMLLLFYAWP